MRRKIFILLHFFLLVFVSCGEEKPEQETVQSVPPLEIPHDGVPDPLAPYLWHLENTGQSVFSSGHGTPGADAHLGHAHTYAKGSGVTVVVSDGRIDFNHADIISNADLSLSRNYVNTEPPFNGNPNIGSEFDSHGTATSGLIGSVKDNGIGGYGVAPKARMVGFNFINSDQTLAKYLDQFTLKGGEVFNYSYGSSTCFVNSFEGINELRGNSIGSKNVYVIAGGNDYMDTLDNCGGKEDVDYLGNGNFDQIQSYPYVIMVGASNANGTIAYYSTPNSNNWIVAPGGDSLIGMILNDLAGCSRGWATSDSPGPFDNNSNGLNPFCSYSSIHIGTSFSAPVASGAIALIKEVNPNLSWRQIKHILAKTAKKINPSDGNHAHPQSENLPGYIYSFGWKTNGAGFSFHNQYGFGQLDIEKAVDLARNINFDLHELKISDSLADKPTYSSGSLNATIPDNSATGFSSTINVQGHNVVLEHVMVTINLNHTDIGQVGIELTSPSGMKSKLALINSHILSQNFVETTFGTNAFYGERSRGAWTLKVVDGKSGGMGTLVSWSLTFLGNKGGQLADTVAPLPISDPAITADNVVSFIDSPSTDIARYEICIFPSSEVRHCLDGDYRSLRDTTQAKLTHYILAGVRRALISSVKYTALIRAVDTSENESAISTLTWEAQ